MENSSDESGFLVHLIIGDPTEAELCVLRKISMKYGFASWDIMHAYLPWRKKKKLRQLFIKLTQKQAISEYHGIRADPQKIREDNLKIIDGIEYNSDFKVKSGIIVNTKWDKSNDEWNEIRQKNMEKYQIDDEEADNIEVPNIIPIDYIRQQCFKRRQSLILFRAAIISELIKRNVSKPGDMKVDELCLASGKQVSVKRVCTHLERETKKHDIFFNPDIDVNE